MSALAERTLAGIVPGDHACCSYGSDEELLSSLGRVALDAMDRGERLTYIADSTPRHALCNALERAGLDTEARLHEGDLELRRSSELYLDAAFDVEEQVAAFAAERERALDDGYSGITVVAEMNWALPMVDDLESLLAYERDVNRLFANGDARAICHYDRRVFAPETIARIEAVHDPCFAAHGDHITARRGALTVVERDGVAGLELAGDLDLATAELAASRIEEHLDTEGDITVDASSLRFADVAGARVLFEASQRLEEGRSVRVSEAPAPLKRVLALCGWADDPRLALES